MRSERGFALLAVMLVLTILSVVVVEFAHSMRLEASMIRSYRDGSLAAHLADAGVQQAIREILAQAQVAALDDDGDLVFYRAVPGQRLPARLPALPRRHVRLGAGEFSYRILDESARLNVNGTDPQRFDRLLAALGLDKAQRDVIVDSVQDWRDRDEIRRLNGAESEDYYLRLPVPYRSRNGNLQDPGELRQIRGITAEFYLGSAERPGLVDLVTVVGGNSVNLNTAPGPVLKALGLSDAEVSDIVESRAHTPYFTVPARFATRGLAVGSATFRVEAVGVVNDTRRRVTAIVQRGSRTNALGFSILSWAPAVGR